MYREYRQSLHVKAGGPTVEKPSGDLKNFYIKVQMHKDSIKAVSFSSKSHFQ
jgi:hypothetical protein